MSDSGEREKATPKSVSIDFVKNSRFRVIHVDGVWGGLSPRGEWVHMHVWNERHPIPKRIVVNVVDKRLGDEVSSEREVRSDFVREVDAGLVMRLDTALGVYKWLRLRLKDGLRIAGKSDDEIRNLLADEPERETGKQEQS